MASQELHLVLGAGQIGPQIAERLLAKGYRVRIGRKSAAPSRVRGVETVSLDVRDPDAVARAAEGASVVYNCVNPLYHQWPELLLPMMNGIVDGTARAGARLVALDNLYVYGEDTSRMNERTPMAPVSKKGRLRQQAADYMLEADARGALKVAIGRAADFFGPDTPLSFLGENFFTRVLAGKSAQVFGDPDQPHSYSFTPDVAAGLVALGTRETRGLWLLPVQPAESTRSLIRRFARALGQEVVVSSVPQLVIRAIGVFQPMIREIAEMTYQWRQPFIVDDTKFRQAFGLAPTPWDEAVAATIAWGRATYASARPRAA